MATEPGVHMSSLPSELVQQITSRLPPSSLHRLCDASHNFGQQPTSLLHTQLTVPLSSLNSCRKQHLDRKDRFTNVRAVTVDGAPTPWSLVLVPKPQLEQMHLTLFLLRLAPTMMQLTRLTLSHLPLTSAVSASACLPAACPHLACIKLHALRRDVVAAVPDLSDLWPALAAIRTLRRLKLTQCTHDSDTGLPGLGAVSQLESLNVGRDILQVLDLSQLTALTKLTLGQVLGLPPAPAQLEEAPATVLALTRLQRLTLNLIWQDLDLFTACGAALTSLAVDSPAETSWDGWDVAWDTFQPSFTALVRLCSPTLDIACDRLLSMPALRELRCCAVELSAVAVGMTQLRTLDCYCFHCAWDSERSAYLKPPALAQTFPRLEALRWVGRHSEAAVELATPADLWPPTAAGRLSHLRALAVTSRTLTAQLDCCAVAVEELVVEWVHHGPLAAGLCRMGLQLRKVDLHSFGVDDDALAALASSWRGVEEVALHSAISVSDVGLVALARLPRLRRVALLSCPHVRAGGVAALASRWSVEVVEVRGCWLVSSEDVAHLERLVGRPQLSIVHSLAEEKPQPWWVHAGAS